VINLELSKIVMPQISTERNTWYICTREST